MPAPRLRADPYSHRFADRQPPGLPPDAPLAARDYAGFRALLDNRRKALKLTLADLDHLAGLPSGYAAKLLTSDYKKHNQQRNIGPDSMGKLLKALGVGLNLSPLEQGHASFNSLDNLRSYQQLHRERSRRGGKARIAKMSDAERFSFFSAIGKAGARSRALKRAQAKKTSLPKLHLSLR